ncbi:uncharacterized protein FOMMEDRAFT_25807 [Fomitiporia mediterranea MF3/22]|uniref:uncharacterized protein n=1 Tax=Fomitiporia mediterranea (strain MF3/22) TaxID=694068 RepID=UPI000440746C|nr:uncharacterized protein FOMMEDRAFT_25807 [Fomitiporia mediterranea MF3/22]EJD06559.1 hypothetical protein FOMMEDRAFT_25807 [Fomitiporia mediterranea MF3/22]
MSFFSVPIIDPENPLYSPEITAQQYMSSVRLFQASVADTSKFPYFHRICNAFLDNAFQDSPQSLRLTHEKAVSIAGSHELGSAASVKEEQDSDSIELASVAAKFLKRAPLVDSSSSADILLKRPPKRVKRSSSHVDMSFVLSAKAERLRFSDKLALHPSSDVKINEESNNSLAEELFWPDEEQGEMVSTEFIEFAVAAEFASGVVDEDVALNQYPESSKAILALLKELERLLPGLRLRDQLDVHTITHQDIVNVLGIKVFIDPTGFQSLRSLVLSDVPLSDDDLMCLNSLLRIESLFIDDTQIGDVAVMHLIALRQSLVHLELSWNEKITDDAIPTLCNFPDLTFLSLKRTAITMKGLRKLACSVKDREKKISIILPSECEEYLCNLHNEYELKLTPPLIHDPDVCSMLSKPALKENLAAHALRNLEITTDGNKAKLEKRLRKVLERRKRDLVVQGFMLQGFVFGLWTWD